MEKQPEQTIEKRKKSVKKTINTWLKNPYTLIFILILLFAIGIRLYYFSQTYEQPLWWDEADYMAYAKTLAGVPGSEWIVTNQHFTLFSYITSIFFMIGLSEAVIRFLVAVIPSILLVFLVYKTTNMITEDKRIGLIITFIFSVSWAVLFNSMRFHVGIPGMIFSMLAMYVFWQGHEKKKKIFNKIPHKWAVLSTVIFVALTFFIRRGFFMLGLFFIIYLLLTSDLKKLIKRKEIWIALFLGIFLLFIWEYVFAVAPVASGEVGAKYYHPEIPLNLDAFKTTWRFFQLSQGINLLFYLFWFGFIIGFFRIILGFTEIRKIKASHYLKTDLFMFISLIIVWLIHFAYFRTQGEPRQFFLLLYPMSYFVSIAILTITDKTKQYIKQKPKLISFIIIALILGYGGYYQIQYADAVITSKIPSFEGIKHASLYVKEHTSIYDRVISVGRSQTAYYAERKTYQPHRWLGVNINNVSFDNFISKLESNPDAKYLILTFSEGVGKVQWLTQVKYANVNGQKRMAQWEIPFMNSTINFINGEQDIKQEKTHNNIRFKLEYVVGDAFVYKIEHINKSEEQNNLNNSSS